MKNVLVLDMKGARSVAKVVANQNCQKIMDLLAEKEHSESEIAKKLNLPISTIHYNLENLRKSGLVVAEEFHYSTKGKEVNHYKLANKCIIIAPKEGRFVDSLKAALPLGIVTIIGTFVISLFETSKKYANDYVASSPQVLESAMDEALPRVSGEIAPKAVSVVANEPTGALWFLIGGLIATVAFVAYDFFKK